MVGSSTQPWWAIVRRSRKRERGTAWRLLEPGLARPERLVDLFCRGRRVRGPALRGSCGSAHRRRERFRPPAPSR
jgi:hypothetical protein